MDHIGWRDWTRGTIGSLTRSITVPLWMSSGIATLISQALFFILATIDWRHPHFDVDWPHSLMGPRSGASEGEFHVGPVVYFALGGLGWTMTEYTLHRGLGHRRGWRNRFTREHMRHHGKSHYFSPLYLKLIALTVVGGAMALLLSMFLPSSIVVPTVAGFSLTYGYYEWLHRHLHKTGPRTRVGRYLRMHHFHHHYANPESNEGLTTPFWDMVFRTHVPVKVVNVPSRYAMPWMLQFPDDYRVV